MKQKHLDLYMKIAEVTADASYAVKMKVGAVAVKDHRVLSIGYNGTPPGDDNQCEDLLEDGSLKTRSNVIHAEMNLIYKMARDGQSAAGADLFITHMPCENCANAIRSAGFSRVWYRHEYHNQIGVYNLRMAGISVEPIHIS